MDGEKSIVQDEKVLKAKSGYAMLLLGIIGMLLGVAVIIAGCMVFGRQVRRIRRCWQVLLFLECY